MTRLLAGTLLIIGAVALTSCENTIRGAGQDIDETVDATGDAINDVAY